MLVLSSLLSCQSGAKITLGGDDTGSTAPASEVALSGPAVADPVLGGDVSWSVTHTGGQTLAIEVRDATGAATRVLADGTGVVDSVTWDGKDGLGATAPPGAYTVHAELREGGEPVAEADAPLTVARLGVSSGTLGGERIALCWHRDGAPRHYWDGGEDTATFELSSIDSNGAATEIPAPWDDLEAPPSDPTNQNMPAAFPWDARPTLTLVFGGDTGGADVTARIDGWTLTSGDVASGTLTFTDDTPLATGPGVVEPTLTLTWLTTDGTVLGTQAIPLRMYALLDVPSFENHGLPYEPWVAVIDPALRAIQGVEPDSEAVISALVDFIYTDQSLAYDTTYGASAYTQYEGSGFDNASFDLTGFLARRNGSIVNCTDCASILEAFSEMLGASLSYTIITPQFDLNYIKAIGGDSYSHCPFTSGRCGFNYHAVTTPDDGHTIFDATLALDGDDDPSTTPSTELLVQAIDGREYLDRLVMSGSPGYYYTQKESFQ